MTSPTRYLTDLREMRERILPMIGVSGPAFMAPDAVNAAMIRHWCAAIGDRNPVYTNDKLAAQSVYGGIIAPPVMLHAWTMPGYGVAIDFDPVFALRAVLDEYGFTSDVATNVEQEYIRPLRLGDRLKLVRTVASLSDEKATPLGRGYFITSRYDLYDSDDQPVAVMLYRSMKFMPKKSADSAAGDARGVAPAATGTARADESGAVASAAAPSGTLPVVMRGSERAIGFPDEAGEVGDELPPTVRAADISVGTRLAPLQVAVTRSFIVASAIATRDYQEVHHDPDAARARGSRDIFTNILTTTGLIGRLVTDSLGPDAQLRSVTVKLGAPNYAGDTLLLEGTVSGKQEVGGQAVIGIGISGRNSLGEHVAARVSVALPR